VDREIADIQLLVKSTGWVNIITGITCLLGTYFEPVLFFGAFWGLVFGYTLLRIKVVIKGDLNVK